MRLYSFLLDPCQCHFSLLITHTQAQFFFSNTRTTTIATTATTNDEKTNRSSVRFSLISLGLSFSLFFWLEISDGLIFSLRSQLFLYSPYLFSFYYLPESFGREKRKIEFDEASLSKRRMNRHKNRRETNRKKKKKEREPTYFRSAVYMAVEDWIE